MLNPISRWESPRAQTPCSPYNTPPQNTFRPKYRTLALRWIYFLRSITRWRRHGCFAISAFGLTSWPLSWILDPFYVGISPRWVDDILTIPYARSKSTYWLCIFHHISRTLLSMSEETTRRYLGLSYIVSKDHLHRIQSLWIYIINIISISHV